MARIFEITLVYFCFSLLEDFGSGAVSVDGVTVGVDGGLGFVLGVGSVVGVFIDDVVNGWG